MGEYWLDGARVQALRNEVIAAIPCPKPSYRRELEALSIRSLFTVYVNWADRFVPARPRRIVYLEDFWSDDAWRHKAAIAAIARKIEAGEDLTGHLSSLIDFRGFAPSRYDADGRLISLKWRDKDFALNAFNVHHLHLAERPARSKELLFVEFTRDLAVMVMIGNHTSFDGAELERRILEARARNGFELKGVRPPVTEGYSATERNELARAGVSTVATVDGKVIIGAMVTTAGTSDYTSRHAGRMLRAIGQLDPRIEDREWVAELFKNSQVPRPDAPQLEWLINYTNVLLIDRASRAAFSIVQGRRGLPSQLSIEAYPPIQAAGAS